MFKPNTLYYSDGYKPGHKRMLAKGTTRLYGTWIPRSIKYAPQGVNKIVSIGQSLSWRWLHDEFQENFFKLSKGKAMQFARDMSLYLGQSYDGKHFGQLWELGYLPIQVQSLPEGIETGPNIPHMTFINTVDGFGWLTLYLETIVSSLSWKMPTSTTLALNYRRVCEEWVKKTDKENVGLIPFLCHDFSSRGLDPFSMISSGLGHAMLFRGSDSLIVIPAARYFYREPEDEVCINSVNASEHSVSTTKIFTVGEKQMIIDWLIEFPTGILSIVADTFDLWKLLMEYIQDPEVKKLIMERDGKLVIRPDSGDPVDIICGTISNILEVESLTTNHLEDSDFEENDYIKCDGRLYKIDHCSVEERYEDYGREQTTLWEAGYDSFYNEIFSSDKPEEKGVIEILWDAFGGTVNEQGYKVLDPHIGAIYGDSINAERQLSIYSRLEEKGFATTNIVLGIGSFTYQYNTRDTFGFAAKGAWFEVKNSNEEGELEYNSYSIYKDPITDDGTKKSLKGFQFVWKDENGEYHVESEVNEGKAYNGINILKTIYKDGEFFNLSSLTKIREKLDNII